MAAWQLLRVLEYYFARKHGQLVHEKGHLLFMSQDLVQKLRIPQNSETLDRYTSPSSRPQNPVIAENKQKFYAIHEPL